MTSGLRLSMVACVIDEMMILDRALSADEMQQIHDAAR